MTLGDRLIVMDNGYAAQIGTPLDIYEKPATRFVAGFIGSPAMNFLDGHISPDGRLVQLNGEVNFPLENGSVMDSGAKDVTLGIRPEAALVQTKEYAQEDGIHVKGTIDVIEPDFGRRRQVGYGHTGNVNFCVVAPLDPHLVQGYPIEVVFPFDALYFFDTTTDRRIRG